MALRAKLWVLLALLAGTAGCAAVAPPQGGPRDTTPPRRIGSSPDSAARNVTQRFVKLVFSEDVQLKDLTKNLLITPQLPSDNHYKTREDRNTVTLIFDKALETNTTYSFNFRSAVVDITESLPAKNAQLSFSTGAVLDSGVVRGTVTDLLTNLPAADAAIALYRETDTLGVRRGQPYYLGRTDKKGLYNLGFLRAGRYQLYAIGDKNNNGRYDDGEKIAYLPGPITIGPTPLTENLKLVHVDDRKPLLTTQQPSPGQLRISFNEGLQTASVVPLPTTDATRTVPPEAVQLADQGRNVLLLKTPTITDGRYLLTVADSSGNVTRDTLNVRFPVPGASARKAAPLPPSYSVVGSPRTVFRQGLVKFDFSVPVVLAPNKPIGTLVEDSVKSRPLRIPTDATLNAAHTQLTIALNTKAKAQVDIMLDSTVLNTVTGVPMRLRRLRLAVTDQNPSGTLSGTINTTTAIAELQLLDNKYQVVQRLPTPKGHYKFDNITPGIYRLRALLDANGDGHWRGGSPDMRTPPEPVYLDPKALTMRADFEIVETLTF